MKKNVQLVFVLILLGALLFSYNNCKGGKTVGKNDGPTLPGSEELQPREPENEKPDEQIEGLDRPIEVVDEPQEDINVIESDFSSVDQEEKSSFQVLTAEGLLYAYSTVTGIPFKIKTDAGEVTNETILTLDGLGGRGLYNSVVGNLPIELKLDKFNSSNLNAIFSLASGFCDQLFNEINPLTEQYYLDEFNKIDDEVIFDMNITSPQSNDGENFNNFLLNKFIPHVEIDNAGKELLNTSLNEMITDYIDIRDSINGFYTTDSQESYYEITKDSSGTSSSPVTFENSFFFSGFILPTDIKNGVGKTEVNDQPFFKVLTDDVEFEIGFILNNGSAIDLGHDITGFIFFRDRVKKRVRYAEFVVNDSSYNNLKNSPYNIVVQYNHDSLSSHVSVENDFQVFVDSKEIELVSAGGGGGYFWNDSYTLGTEDRPDKNLVVFAVVDNSGSSKISKISSLARDDLLLGHFEIHAGDFNDYILTKEEKDELGEFDGSSYLNKKGFFWFPQDLNDLQERNPLLYFGRNIEGNDENYIYTHSGYRSAYKSDGTWVVGNGGVKMTGVKQSLDTSNREWEEPFYVFGPLMCTTILASQYFIFN